MLIIPLNTFKAIHIHHWIIYLLILLLQLFIYIPSIICGFSFGLYCQGLTYNDCFNFICNNPY
jgi:hypothetical protein